MFAAAVTPVKYECDAKNLTGTFARSKILLMEELTNGVLVTPTPDLQIFRWTQRSFDIQKNAVHVIYTI